MTDSFKSELHIQGITPGDFFFLNCTNTTNINVSFHLFPYF